MIQPPQLPVVLSEPKQIFLALQGGGSHAAFTWGVLDRLLEEDKLTIGAVSGTGVGSINGALLVSGLATGGMKKAKQLLDQFWQKVSIKGGLLMQPTMMDKIMGKNDLSFNPTFAALDYVTRFLSPYQFNALDLNPIKDVVEDLVDFEALRQFGGLKLYVNATHVNSGEGRVFNQEQLSLDVLMASLCLPFLSQTVEIDGEPYWSGGFTGNPALTPLVEGTDAPQVVVIQTTSAKSDDVPTNVHDIIDRVTEISYHASFAAERKLLEVATNAQFDCIEAEDILNGLGRSSKFNADSNFLKHLKDTGRQAAEDWLQAQAEKAQEDPADTTHKVVKMPSSR